MPALWPGFTAAMNAWFCGDAEGGWVKATMQSGFEASFAQQMQAAGAPPEGIDIGVPVWLTAATGTVNAWAAVQYQPVPPHPPTVAPAPGVTQLDPGMGAIPGLASTINDAFHSNNCAAVAGILVSGFTQHLTMISGLYTGLVPTPAGPVPTPVPWMGVS